MSLSSNFLKKNAPYFLPSVISIILLWPVLIVSAGIGITLEARTSGSWALMLALVPVVMMIFIAFKASHLISKKFLSSKKLLRKNGIGAGIAICYLAFVIMFSQALTSRIWFTALGRSAVAQFVIASIIFWSPILAVLWSRGIRK